MKKKFLLEMLILISIFTTGCVSTGLGKFGADIGAKSIPILGIQRFPYSSTVKYFGYIMPGEKPDAVVNDKKEYYLYLWIPAIAPEIGIRMLSPVAGMISPQEGDIVAPSYEQGLASDPGVYFDTWIRFERALAVLNPDDIKANAKTTPWIVYDTNDDSSEMPKQPSGSHYNSLMRLNAGDEPLIRGLYRIAFTTYKTGEVEGSFFAEVGAPIKLPGVVIAKTVDELIERINSEE